MSVMPELNKVFQLVFANAGLNVTTGMTPNDIEGWDSMAHVNLMRAVESRFQVKFQKQDLRAIRTVGDLARLIEAKQR